MTRLFNYLIEAIRSPREQLSLGQQFVRKSVDLVVYCYRQLQRQRADGMAAELTYRTIFALIPVVVLGLVMFRVVGGLEDVQAKVENQLFSFFGVPDITQGYEPLIQSDATDSEARTEQQEDVPPLQTTEALSNPRQLSPPPQESAASSSNTGTTITPQNSTLSTAGKPESIAS
ncbi:MAG: ribonuclease BN, partial [Rubripirellula sp.]